MKQKIIVFGAIVALLVPSGLRAQDENKPVTPAERQQMREQLKNMSPEERQAKIREMREKALQAGGDASRAGQGAAGSRLGGDIERIAMVLTPEQREFMRKSIDENREKTRDLEEKVRAARKAVLDATLDKKFDETVLRQKLEAAAKLDIDFMVIRAKALSKVEPPLTDEQINRIKNQPMGEMMRPRVGQGTNGDNARPRPATDGPRDVNDLPPKK